MAGHSKWAQIKHKKAVVDAKRSKEFGKIARLISVESRLVGGDISSPSLKVLIDKAKAANMPKENIERAVQKGAGVGGQAAEQITYEMYGPGGVAILIDTFTDNRNRTVQELKHLVSELGYQLADPGAAQWAFVKNNMVWTPTTTIPVSDTDAEALDVLVSTLEEHDDVEDVYTNAA
jgi:YebC/PmpR family DNA-binding regulatory protein